MDENYDMRSKCEPPFFILYKSSTLDSEKNTYLVTKITDGCPSRTSLKTYYEMQSTLQIVFNKYLF